MLEPRPVAKHIHHHRKDVVGFMIGCMRLQETDMIVDCIGQPDMLGKLEHGGNTSVVDGLSAISEFVFD
jgi:uncharacterized protein YcsI (UPF0317 family)